MSYLIGFLGGALFVLLYALVMMWLDDRDRPRRVAEISELHRLRLKDDQKWYARAGARYP